MDVKNAFLNGKLKEDVYMTQPEGFVTPGNATKVCKLQRSIYGLKQASRSWNLRFNDAIKEFGFIRNEDEPCVYKKISGSIISFLILYVDDILIIGNDIPNLQSIKTWLSSCFSMKDLGEATYILGVKTYRDRSRRLIGLSQSTYIDKVLKRFSMEESKRGFLPMRHGISLSKEMCPSTPQERERMSQISYASAIGSIMYAMICTRPDLSYALSMTNRYQTNPGEGHWIAVKNILKYLRRTKDVFLVYGGEKELGIKGYTDASFQTTKDDSRSQSDFIFCLNGASEVAKEIVWIKKFIPFLGVVTSIPDAIELYCDNNGAIVMYVKGQQLKALFLARLKLNGVYAAHVSSSSAPAPLAQLKLTSPEAAETYPTQGRVSYENVDSLWTSKHVHDILFEHMHGMCIPHTWAACGRPLFPLVFECMV
ncbi:hypothetical protein V6N12_012885 [Hibiscus sabdariffa]|uniref:Reverse transcriptase Ty1/copia-type domain-containing protein n=1 Tax=Hibiscus sabdariffa TaxID=183260 RepID=A0ABR2EJF7_9ROSI